MNSISNNYSVLEFNKYSLIFIVIMILQVSFSAPTYTQCVPNNEIIISSVSNNLIVSETSEIDWQTTCNSSTTYQVSLINQDVQPGGMVVDLIENVSFSSPYLFSFDPSINYNWQGTGPNNFIFSIADENDPTTYFDDSQPFIIHPTLPIHTLDVQVLDNETCPSSGEISFQASGQLPHSTITYIVSNSSGETKAVIIDTTGTQVDVLTGLIADTYAIEAIQTINGVSESVFQNVSVLDELSPIEYTVTFLDETCTNNGSITVVPTSGQGLTYSLTSSQSTWGPQSSETFDQLAPGTYTLTVNDTCQSQSVTTITLSSSSGPLEITNTALGVAIEACDSIVVSTNIASNTELHYPIDLIYTITDPSSNQIIVNKTLESGPQNTYLFISKTIPFYGNGVAYTYDLEIIDNCGNSVLENNIEILVNNLFYLWQYQENCHDYFNIPAVGFKPPITLNFNSTPAAFDPLEFNPNYPEGFINNLVSFKKNGTSVPYGKYTFEIEDACGSSIIDSFELEGLDFKFTSLHTGTDCSIGEGNMRAYYNDKLMSVFCLNAPEPSLIGADFSENILSVLEAKSFRVVDLPAGEYTFAVSDSCGRTDTSVFDVTGYQNTFGGITIDTLCGSIDLYFEDDNNFYQEDLYNLLEEFYYLHIFNEENNEWTHLDGSPILGTANEIDGYRVYKSEINNNIIVDGRLRLARVVRKPGIPHSNNTYCTTVLEEFEFRNGGFAFDSLFSIQCVDNSVNISEYTLVCEAKGVAPLSYEITSIDGIAQSPNPQSENIFEHLAAGIYNIQVKDACGNLENKEIDLTNITVPVIQADSLCIGERGRLFTQDLPYLDFSWLHIETGNIISTTYEVVFDPFDPAQHVGTYSLMTSLNGISCLNQSKEFTIPLNTQVLPNSGADLTFEVCDTIPTIDLDQYLSPDADGHGLWYEHNGQQITNTENYNVGNLSLGLNTFQYVVNGYCTGSDTAIINLKLDTCSLSCIEFIGKIKLSTPIGAQPGYSMLVLNPNGTIGYINTAGYSSDSNPVNEIQTISSDGSQITLSHGGGTIPDKTEDADSDFTNELQSISSSGDSIVLSLGGGAILDKYIDADSDTLNEIQTLSIQGDQLTLSMGNTITIPTPNITGDNLGSHMAQQSLDMSNYKIININPPTNPSDAATMSYVDNHSDTDADPLNEIQVLSISNDTIYLDQGGFAVLPENQDPDPTNELQNISASNLGDTLYLSGGGFLIIPGISAANFPPILDGDGNPYTPIEIGTQTWLKENLWTTKFIDGTPIPNIELPAEWPSTTNPHMCWYNNDSTSYAENLGALYNWEVVTSSLNVCPIGYRVPGLNDFVTLINFVGGEENAGNKLKEQGTTRWATTNSNVTNEYGFTSVGSGRRYENFNTQQMVYSQLYYNTQFWTSTNVSTDEARVIYMGHAQGSTNPYCCLDEKINGNPIRCIKE